MPYDADTQKRFQRRTADIYRHQRDRAAKFRAQLPYGAAELRAWVLHRLRPPDGTPAPGCHYCGRALGVLEFSLDHARPVSRGGDWGLSNQVLSCAPCNEAKGDLTEQEFAALLECVRQWPPRGAESLLRRLRQSWRVFKR